MIISFSMKSKNIEGGQHNTAHNRCSFHGSWQLSKDFSQVKHPSFLMDFHRVKINQFHLWSFLRNIILSNLSFKNISLLKRKKEKENEGIEEKKERMKMRRRKNKESDKRDYWKGQLKKGVEEKEVWGEGGGGENKQVLGHSIEVIIICPTSSTLGHIPKGLYILLQRYFSPMFNATLFMLAKSWYWRIPVDVYKYISIHWWIDNEHVVHIYNEILFIC